MDIKKYLVSRLTAILIIPCFAMCSKSTIEKAKDPNAASLQDVKPQTEQSPVKSPDATNTYTYTVKSSEWFVDGTNIPAGAIIYIPAGKRGALLLKNIKGTEARPIKIVNKGGKVTFTAALTASYSFKTQNCQFFKILGNGVPGITYGFNVNGGNIGMTMDDLSSDFEIANVEVRNSGFAGIMAKTDPSCDIETQRGHFTMKNILLHNNYVHKTGGEGFYVGNSFYAEGRSLSCGTVLPHDVSNVKIYNNLVDSAGCEGIQVGAAIAGCEVYNNKVTSPGLSPFASGQNNGIQIGEGTGGKCYNNLVKNAPGNGIIVLGLGDNQVFNNFIINSGANGIFADSRYTPGPNFQFINNTIINSSGDGIKLNSESIPMNTVINNAIVKSGSGVAIHRMDSDVKITLANNYIGNNIDALKFVDYDDDDFHLQPSSPLINAGTNVLLYGISIDFYGVIRSVTGGFDIGATSY